MAYNRDEVLARTELAALADELLGPHRGRGSSSAWPCPDPGHGSQTGRTPPVTVFRAQTGDERWRCHACGAGGTAVDLVMTTQGVGFRQAIEQLGGRAGAVERDGPPSELRPARILRPASFAPGSPSPEVERYVAACEEYLWSQPGRPMRDWLGERGLGEEILRANRVGADPGPQRLRRARGLPRGGPAVVLPVLGEDGRALYLQTRYLRPRTGRKYDNPAAHLVGPSPRLGEARLACPAVDKDVVLVCEGLPDALTAAQHGHRAVAVLGAGLPDARVATALSERFPNERLVVSFDADARGVAGADRLEALLSEHDAGSRVGRLEVPLSHGDLNAWQQKAGQDFGAELGRAVDAVGMATRTHRHPSVSAQRDSDLDHHLAETSVRPRPAAAVDGQGRVAEHRSPARHEGLGREEFDVGARQAPPSPQNLDERLELIYYHHVLVDDAELSAAAAARVKRALHAWPASEPEQAAGNRHPSLDRLEERLADVRYHHVLVDDPELASRSKGRITESVERWTAEVGLAPSATRTSASHELSAGTASGSGPNELAAGTASGAGPEVVPAWWAPPPTPQPDLGVGM